MGKAKVRAALRRTAKMNNVSYSEMMEEIRRAMAYAMASDDPLVQERWASVPRKGEVPTPEEFIAYTSELILRRIAENGAEGEGQSGTAV